MRRHVGKRRTIREEVNRCSRILTNLLPSAGEGGRGETRRIKGDVVVAAAKMTNRVRSKEDAEPSPNDAERQSCDLPPNPEFANLDPPPSTETENLVETRWVFQMFCHQLQHDRPSLGGASLGF